MVRTSERVHGEASERALRSKQRGVQETPSKVTPAIVPQVIGGKSRRFSSFVNEPGTFSPFFAELGELMRSPSQSLQSSLSVSAEK